MVSWVHRCQGTKERREPQVHNGRQTCFPELEVLSGTAEHRLQRAVVRDTEGQGGQVDGPRR